MKEVIRENVAVVTFIKQPNVLMQKARLKEVWPNDREY